MLLSLKTAPRVLIAALAAFALTAALLLAMRGTDPAPDDAMTRALPSQPRPNATTDERIASYEAIVKARPRTPAGYSLLAAAYLQKHRETGDGALYGRADRVIARGLAFAPTDPGLLTERASLKLSRHDFAGGLRDARLVTRANPTVVRPYGLLVDALVELGRYEAAEAALQRMVDLKPNLSSYARVSYFRELHGDIPGAREGLELAASAGAATPESVAYVQTLLGNLELTDGRTEQARRAYRQALASRPGHDAALIGLAKIDFALGNRERALRSLRATVTPDSSGEFIAALGDAELAAGNAGAARKAYALVNQQHADERAQGLNPDAGMVLFEAEHGSEKLAVRLGRELWRVAPSVSTAHALGWALTEAGRPEEGLEWARRSLKLGSRDPLFLYHAGIAASEAGRPELARRWLTRALDRNPRFSPVYGPRAERVLARLS
jgi:tetratricopeptide (TPR) repeat protein